jgi:tetratricopeptide (TPR) repeat protein
MNRVIRNEKMFISVVGVLTLVLLMWHTKASADIDNRYRPPVLSKAELALERGNPARAIELMGGSISNSPRSAVQAEVSSILCRAHFQQNEFLAAEEACTRALDMGGSAGAWSDLNNRGVMRMLQGRFDDAVEDFETAIRSNPRAREARRNLTLARELRKSQAFNVSAAE